MPTQDTNGEDFLTASLHHGNLQVDVSDPEPRPMIAVLDAKPGLEEAFRERIAEVSTGGPGSLIQLNEIPIPE